MTSEYLVAIWSNDEKCFDHYGFSVESLGEIPGKVEDIRAKLKQPTRVVTIKDKPKTNGQN